MQRRILRAFIAMLALTLASCGGGGMVKRINPPAASVQQLRVADDGSWSLVLRINKDVKVPVDSIAAIRTRGLIGEKFVKITPGGDNELLKSGQEISETESVVDLEEMIGKFIYDKK